MLTLLDTIFKLPLSHAATVIENLQGRYTQLCERKDKLPYMFNLRAPEQLDVDVISRYLPSNFFSPPSKDLATTNSQPTEINKPALLMALFGWEGYVHDQLGAQLDSVSCQACFRVLGLWLFKSKKVNEAGEEVLGPVVNGLDVVMEHRDYCPWRNAASQNGHSSTKTSASTMSGSEIILRVLKNDQCLRMANEGGKLSKQSSTDNNSENTNILDIDDDEDAQSIRDEEDKRRWARLRRVKSLFDTKGGKKLTRNDTRSTKAST